MTREEGLKQIDAAEWTKQPDSLLELRVNNERGRVVLAWLTMRPTFCDRGHLQLNIEGPLDLDHADSFPRYFFSFQEADLHTRMFLRWRLWQERTTSYDELCSVFGKNTTKGGNAPWAVS